MTVPSVERRNRRAPIEKARQGRDWTALWTSFVVFLVWSVVFALADPQNSQTKVAICVVTSVVALVFALAARRIEPERRRDSHRWNVLAGLALGCAAAAGWCFEDDPWRAMLIGISVVVAVFAVLGKFPEHARAAAPDGEEFNREPGRAD